MTEVVCLGILVADVVGKPIDSFPRKGTLASVDRIELHVGGCAANTALALARLGVPTSIIGKIGDDGFGRFIRNTLEEAGVYTHGLSCDSQSASSATMVAVDSDGERTFLHYPGANAAFRYGDIDWNVVAGAKIVHVAGPFLMPDFMGEECAQACKCAQEMGKITTLDTVWDFTGRWMDVLKPTLPFLDYVLPSLEEAKQITGCDDPREIARVLLDCGVKAVGVKLGEAGCYFRTAGGDEFDMAALAVDATDLLGAGDAWSAGLLCALTRGWSLKRAARFANAVGASAVTALGATTGVKSFASTYEMAFGNASR
jgi:sugar/nucleoside kinase (ribokinase family)